MLGLLKKRKTNRFESPLAWVDAGGFPDFDDKDGAAFRAQMFCKHDLLVLVSQAEQTWDAKWLPWLDAQLCRQNPDDPGPLCSWICHEIAFGNRGAVQALKAILGSMKIDRDAPDYLNTTARLSFFEGDAEAGGNALATLAELHPEYDRKWALAEKANCHIRSKDWEALQETLSQLLKLNPGDRNIVALAIRSYAEAGNQDLILSLIEEIGGQSEIDQEYVAYLYLNALDLCGHKTRCLNEGIDLLDAHPDFFSLYFLLRGVAHSLDTAHLMEPVFETAVRLYPDNPLVLEIRCLSALDQDDFDGIEALLKRFPDKDGEPFLRFNLTYLTTRPGAGGAKAAYEDYRASGVGHVGPEVQYAGYLIGSASDTYDLLCAHDVLASQIDKGSRNINYIKMLVQSFVALERFDEAKEYLETVAPQLRQSLPLWEVEQYFRQANGQHAGASKAWGEMAESGAYRAVTNASDLPERVTFNYDPGRDQLLAFACVYNAIEFSDWFLNYYRALGVDHFIIVDNGSNDGTAEAFAAEPDVSVFSQPGSFKDSAHGVYWINHLMRTYAQGKWAFFVDMDEAFVFPGQSEGRSLHDLLSYCDANGFGAMPSFMLDMFPACDSSDFDACDCFDNSYFSFPSLRPPYRTIQGGFRSRLTDRNFLITKSPLVKVSKDFYYLENNHTHTHLSVADVETALLHYKFIGDAQKRFDEAVERKQHFMGARFYKDLKRSSTAGTFERVDCTLTYKNTKQLEDLGLIKGSEGWTAFCPDKHAPIDPEEDGK